MLYISCALNACKKLVCFAPQSTTTAGRNAEQKIQPLHEKLHSAEYFRELKLEIWIYLRSNG